MLFVLTVLAVLGTPYFSDGKIINLLDAGATPGKVSTKQAFKNTAVVNSSLARLQPGDTLLIPIGQKFTIMGGVRATGLVSVTIQLDGTFLLCNDIKAWPKKGKMPIVAIQLDNSTNLTLTSSNKNGGLIDGNGATWWGVPGVGYLLRGKDRPPMLSINNATNFIFENWNLLNAPRFNFISTGLNFATIRNCHVSARRQSDDGHSTVDLTAFNTDGFDIAGRNIHVHDCSVWNQDDTFCIKTKGGDTENVLIERVNASGVGLSVGGIGGHSVRNVTFRNIHMHHTVKGIYMKFVDSAFEGRGFIHDILYENIIIEKPSSWPIWIGPAQQDIKEKDNKGTYNPCHGNPCSLCWPTVPTANCRSPSGQYADIVLRNITINNPKTSPGVIFGNNSTPIKNLTFDSVVFKNPPPNGHWGKDYFFCKGVAGGIATGGTWPVPKCFKNMNP